MRKTRGLCLMAAGTVLLLAALFLLLYNMNQDYTAQQKTDSILVQLKEQMPQPHRMEAGLFAEMTGTQPATQTNAAKEDVIVFSDMQTEEVQLQPVMTEADLFAEYAQYEPVQETIWWIDGDAYLGTVSIPSLGLELPVLSEWSYPNLNFSPCRYTGSVEEGNLVLAAHNYNSHFGRISELNSGETIIFTDGDGVMHEYYVLQSELIDGKNVPEMQTGAEEWDLTLFTCTLSGASRVTVRAALVGE